MNIQIPGFPCFPCAVATLSFDSKTMTDDCFETETLEGKLAKDNPATLIFQTFVIFED